MAQLQTTAQFPGLSPDILGQFSRGEAAREQSQQFANQERLRQISQQDRDTRFRALGVPEQAPEQETPEQARQRLIASDPAAAKAFMSTVGIDTQEKREGVSLFADQALNATDLQMQQQIIENRIQQVEARGGDATESRALLAMPPEQRQAALQGMKRVALTALQRETFDAKRSKLTAEGEAVDEVKRSEILADGTVQLVRKSGAIEIVPASKADKILIDQARKKGAGYQGLRAGERTAATEA